MSPAPRSIDADTRAFNLVLALVSARRGLTRGEIFERVHGYRQRFEVEGSSPALQRLFERDKALLIDLGLPLSVDEEGPLNARVERYRIPRSAFEVSEAIEFTAEEIALMTVAASLWRDGTLGFAGRTALDKLRSDGVDVDATTMSVLPRFRASDDDAFRVLTRALRERRRVAFDYRRAGSERAHPRTVSPLALLQRDGHWMLIALDDFAGEPRTFLISRLTSPIAALDERFDPGEEDWAARATAELDELERRQRVVLLVDPTSRAMPRLSQRADRESLDDRSGWQRVEFGATDLELLADDLLLDALDVRVLAPDALRRGLVARLDAMLAAHGEVSA